MKSKRACPDQRKQVSPQRVVHRSLLAWLATAALLSSCADGPTPKEEIRARMVSNPEQFRRVEILPIWFDGMAETDPSLTANDLKSLNREVGRSLTNVVLQVLTNKGYQVVQTSGALCDDEDLAMFDPGTRQLLTTVRTNLLDLILQIYANEPNQKGKPFDFRAAGSLNELRAKMGMPEADLVVWVDSKAFFESPAEHHRRSKKNWTEGAALTPLVIGLACFGSGPGQLPLEYSPCWMEHKILVIDPRSQAVLFWNARKFPREDARNANALKDKFKDLVADLPEFQK